MAKKSARSKGFRKVTEKKPYLSKKEIIALCAMLAVVLVGAILLFSYDDGALKVKDGKIVDRGDNWVVVNGSSNGRRYFKLATVTDLDGYTLESTPSMTDENILSYKYTPAEEGAPTLTITGVPAKPERAASYYQSLINALTPTEVSAGDIGGVQAQYFSYQASSHVDENAEEGAESADNVPSDEAPADEAQEDAPNHFEQAFHAYFPAIHDSSIGIGVQVSPDSEAGYLTEDQLKDLVARAYAAVTLETK